MYVLSELGILFVRRNALKGREKEWGMWPEERPGRGSGSEPRYLVMDQIELGQFHVRDEGSELTFRGTERREQARQ